MQVTEIYKMDRDTLISTWAEIGSGPVPHRMSAVFMRHVLAFEAQAKVTGGLAKSFRNRLSKAASVKVQAEPPRALRPGSRLMREWNGVTHSVEVTEDGLVWKGAHYRSLSAIARAITGAHWSGPRFFNLGADK